MTAAFCMDWDTGSGQGFNVAQARDLEEFFVHWIDVDERKEVEAARKSGRTWPGGLQVFEQFKRN